MWSAWLVSCVYGFHPVCPLMGKDRGSPDGRDWLSHQCFPHSFPSGRNWVLFWWSEKLGLVLMVRTILSKSLIQFSVDGWDCVPSLLFDQRPNYGGGNEDNDKLLQNVPCTHCCTQCPWPCSRSLLIHASSRNYWTLTGKSGSVSCGIIDPFSWVLLHTRFCLCPPRVCSPSPV